MRRIRTACLVAAALAGAACTVPNPDYLGPNGIPPGGDAGEVIDARAPDALADLSRRARDLSGPCSDGDRSCGSEGEAAMSMVCSSEVYLPDRECPTNSMCSDGFCRPPPSSSSTDGKPCVAEGDCSGIQLEAYSCQPFIDPDHPTAVEFVCAAQVGRGGSGVQCTRGSDCRSGVCISSTGTCFRACRSDDCPRRSGLHTVCKEAIITVEGTTVKAKSCVLER